MDFLFGKKTSAGETGDDEVVPTATQEAETLIPLLLGLLDFGLESRHGPSWRNESWSIFTTVLLPECERMQNLSF